MRTVPYVRCSIFAIVVMLVLAMPTLSTAQVSVGVTVAFAPPDLPVYEQPICPGEGYIWTPGFWAYDYDYEDYYWVPGTWVLAPEVGFLWTPGYWGWGGSGFVFYEGYWAYQVVGFYGGINYGYGYFGRGYEGGRWEGDRFFYNRTVNNVNVTEIHNVYNTTVVNERNVTRVSYTGGNGGVNARPTPQEEAAAHGRRLPPAAPQRQHIQEARSNPQLRASVNRGKPPIAATPTPNAFSGRGVVSAREGGAIHGGPRNASPRNAGRNNAPPENNNRRAVHPNDLPPIPRPAPPNTGNSRQDRKYQQREEKMYAQQERQRQKLQQQQEKEHQRLERQNVDQGRRQQVEQRHQQQTEQLQQRHSQQQQRMQEREQSRSAPPPPQKEKH